MRRYLRYAQLALVLGLLVSVAVAWFSAATLDLWANIYLQRHGATSNSYPCCDAALPIAGASARTFAPEI